MKTSIWRRRLEPVFCASATAVACLLTAIPVMADGLDQWHRRDAGASNYISALTYSPASGFVAVDQNGPLASGAASALLISADGKTWERRPAGTNDLMTDRIAAGDGQFRTVWASQYAFPGGRVLQSSNGVHWSVLDLDFFGEGLVVKSVEYLNGRWLAAGVPQSDGIIIECGEPFGPPCPEQQLRVFGLGSGWVDLEVPPFGLGGDGLNLISADFAYGDGVWVVLAWLYRGEYFDPAGFKSVALFAWSSNDGTNFVRSPALVQSNASLLNAIEPFPCNVVHGNGRFVAVGNVAGIYSSANGQSWSTNFPSPAATVRDVAFGGGHFVAVGGRSGTGAGAIVTSTDGVNWQHRDSGTPEFLRQVEYGNHTFLITGGNFEENLPKLVLQSDPLITLHLGNDTAPNFTLSAPVGSSCRIECVSDLNSGDPWQMWTRIVVTTDPLVFPAPARSEPRRFFRAVMEE